MGTMLDPTRIVGHKVLDTEGNKIGQAGEVWQDSTPEHHQWVMIKAGLLGGKAHLAPVEGATLEADDLRLRYDKATVDSAPEIQAGSRLTPQQERALYQHYGIGDGFRTAQVATEGSTGGPRGATRSGDGYLTRWEEQMRVGTERFDSGRARLHKYTTTAHVAKTVPVTHEEVRVERELIPDGEHAGRAGLRETDWTELDQDMVLHAERATVSKEAVPVERVRVRVEQVREEVTVEDDVRVEHIEVLDGIDSAEPKADGRRPPRGI